MIRPATHRVTIDGLEMDLDDNGEIVRVWSEPAPSIGASFTEGEPLSSAELAALDIARAEVVSRDDVAALSEAMAQQGLGPMAQHAFSECEPTYALSHRFGWPDADGVMRCACGAWSDSPAARPCRIHAPAISDLREPFEQSMNIAEYVAIVQAEHMAPDDPDDEERQRCERLGVEWVGPDVQAVLYGPQFAERDAAGMLDRERLAASGDLVRLGCELREADGVTARCLRSGMTRRTRGWPSQTHGSTLENGSWRPDSTLRAFGSVGRMRIESR